MGTPKRHTLFSENCLSLPTLKISIFATVNSIIDTLAENIFCHDCKFNSYLKTFLVLCGYYTEPRPFVEITSCHDCILNSYSNLCWKYALREQYIRRCKSPALHPGCWNKGEVMRAKFCGILTFLKILSKCVIYFTNLHEILQVSFENSILHFLRKFFISAREGEGLYFWAACKVTLWSLGRSTKQMKSFQLILLVNGNPKSWLHFQKWKLKYCM